MKHVNETCISRIFERFLQITLSCVDGVANKGKSCSFPGGHEDEGVAVPLSACFSSFASLFRQSTDE